MLKVIDGDSCQLDDGREVRYLGINAPEEGEAQYREATQANNNLVGGKGVKLEFDRPVKDRHGRLLAYVFVDKTCVNVELARQGHAHVSRPVTLAHRKALLDAQVEARAAGLGIWAKDGTHSIAISKVQADPPGSDRDNLAEEYIVIENRSAKAIDLTGWTVSDEVNRRYLFPRFALAGSAKVTLRSGLGKNTGTDLFWGSRGSIWNNDGDTIFIRDAAGSLVLVHVY